MDLSGRASGYRGIAIRCPGCAEPMRAQALAEAEIDVCDACGGFWLDWFDGEPRAVASEALRASRVPGSAPARSSDLRNEAIALGACPRCSHQLVAERYVLSAKATPGQVTGADLLRCEECAGAFVPRASAEMLAVLPADDTPPPSEAPRVLEPLPWQRFVAAVKSFVGRK